MTKNNLKVIFVDERTVLKVEKTPNPDIFPNSYGKGLLNIRKGKNSVQSSSVGSVLSPLLEDANDQDIYFKPTALVDDNLPGNKYYGFGTPKKGQLYIENNESKSKSPYSTPKNSTIISKTKSTPKTPKLNTICQTPKSIKLMKTPCRTPRTSKVNVTPNRTPSTPKLNCTPNNRGSRLLSTPRTVDRVTTVSTPYSFRKKVKQRILDVVLQDDDEEEYDDSDLDGNYSPIESSEESDLEVSDINDNVTPAKHFKDLLKYSMKSPMRTPRRGRLPKVDVDMAASSDDYFLHNSELQCMTSDHTLNRLETPRLGPDAIKSLLGSVSSDHLKEKEDLLLDHMTLFPHWMTLLLEGFSIFLCGVGSKKQLLSRFQVNMLCNFDHLVINGFFPSLTLRNILSSILGDILEVESHPQGIDEMLTLIQAHYNNLCEPLFLVIHNLDGPMLRADKPQLALSTLASFKNIHIIASMDHINAPLIFDSNKSSLFNPLWWDATTLAHYSEETSYENSLLVQQSGALALSSLIHVFKSLTPNAKGIFLLLAKHQLDQKEVPNYSGLSFGDLYQRCRESFLVNSDLTLRAQLTEFKDHKLIKTKKGFDGVETLLIPLDASILQEFIAQQNE